MAEQTKTVDVTAQNLALFEGLEPAGVFRHFCALSAVPRVPGSMQKVSDFIVAFAESLGLCCRRDGHCNVVVTKPAHPQRQSSPGVMLQAHLDMVCEKEPGSPHNFAADPLRLRLDGTKVTASGTTLGADNGVGVAYMMALMEDAELVHPKLELVFTTDEETDMSGAANLEFDKLESRIVLNLDSPPIGVCGAGELEARMRLPVARTAPKAGAVALALSVGGLVGGHTGQNAMLERGNAITLLNRLLMELRQRVPIQLADFQGGAGMSSAFARSAQCVVLVDSADTARVAEVASAMEATFKRELKLRDPDVAVRVETIEETPASALSDGDFDKLCNLLLLLPDGVFLANKQFPGYMEACSNVGVISLREEEAYATILIRSVTDSTKYYLHQKVVAVCRLLGAQCETGHDVPQWDYNVDEDILALLRDVYKEDSLKVSPGTLECGFFCRHIPNACVLSLGCPYYNAHSPSEYFLTDEALKYWDLLLQFLRRA